MLTFTPYGTAGVHKEFEDDTDWLVAGSWMINPADNETGNFEFGAFAYGGDPFVTDTTTTLMPCQGYRHLRRHRDWPVWPVCA